MSFDMKLPSVDASYLLGDTSAEHQRLIRQAAIFEPFTERLFRDAGVGPGQRVLDIGSGVGDVAMLAARLIGPTGEVVGVERDATTLAMARSRVDKAGLSNVRFLEADVGLVPSSEPFDAVVGRLILEFMPDPGAIVGSLAALVRPGGAIIFQDACWGPWLQLTAPLPLRGKCASIIYKAFERSGANMDMEFVLYRALQAAGLPAPRMRVEVPVGDEPDIARWVYDLFCTLLPQMREEDLPNEMFGDLDTLQSRLEAERVAAKAFGACVGLVGAWSVKGGPHSPCP
jgi:ubiquinone/menaquinone biosynthesis C-methylase UbiE